MVPRVPLLVRADGHAAIGMGHVMRCVGLMEEAVRRGHRVAFLGRCDAPRVVQRLRSAGVEVISSEGEDLPGALAALRSLDGPAGRPWLVLDGYHFGPAYFSAVRRAGFPLLVVDDLADRGPYDATLLLNQNAGARRLAYDAPGCGLLLGPRYALLRSEFRGMVRPPAGGASRRVLVTMGGADPGNLAEGIVRAVARIPDADVLAVVGPASPHADRLAGVPAERVRVVRDPPSMADLMAWADVAVAAAGTTTWEIACAGLPSVLVVAADNQAALAREMDALGAAVSLGRHERLAPEDVRKAVERLLADPGLRERMSAAGRALVDGGGAARVLRRVEGLELRSATMADARLLWTWANEPDVRRSSLSPDPIPWESHERWLSARLASPDCRMLIAHDPDGAPVGQIRFDRSEGEAEIDVSVAPQARGEGWGAEIIRLGCERVHAEDFAGRLHARVLPSNAASLRAFERAGFRQAGAATVKGKETVHLVREPA